MPRQLDTLNEMSKIEIKKDSSSRYDYENIYLSLADSARLLGISRQALDKWKLRKTFKKGREVYLNLTEIVDKRLHTLQRSDEESIDAKQLLAKRQAEKVEIEIEVLKGKLIPVDVVVSVWSTIAGNFKSKLLTIPSKLGLVLAAMTDARQIEETLRKAVNEPLAEFEKLDEDEYIKDLKTYGTGDGNDQEEPENRIQKRKRRIKTTE